MNVFLENSFGHQGDKQQFVGPGLSPNCMQKLSTNAKSPLAGNGLFDPFHD